MSPKIPTFTPLSPCTSIYIPLSRSSTKPPPPPNSSTITHPPPLILLCTYLNASPTHIIKYISGYKRLFPTSRILLVTTTSSHFLFQSTAQWISDLDPAVQTLLALRDSQHQGATIRKEEGESEGMILLHMISTGGATAVMKIASAYREKTGCAMPVRKVVLESCPGVGGVESTVGAFEVGLQSYGMHGSGGWGWGWGFVARVKALLLGIGLRVFFKSWFLFESVMGMENVVGVVRRKLNDTSLFSTDATRMYIYGGKDELVRAQDVEEHADEAQKIGYEVFKVRYGDCGHAGHLLQDKGRFWTSVARLWDSGVLSGPGMIVCAW